MPVRIDNDALLNQLLCWLLLYTCGCEEKRSCWGLPIVPRAPAAVCELHAAWKQHTCKAQGRPHDVISALTQLEPTPSHPKPARSSVAGLHAPPSSSSAPECHCTVTGAAGCRSCMAFDSRPRMLTCAQYGGGDITEGQLLQSQALHQSSACCSDIYKVVLACTWAIRANGSSLCN